MSDLFAFFDDSLFALWDDMAGFDAARGDEALDHLMNRLCERVGGHNAICVGAVRMPDILLGDPLQGWRARLIRYLFDAPDRSAVAREQARLLEAGEFDVTTARNVAGAGRWRANRLIDLAGAEWFESAYYRACYRDIGHGDAIWAGCPVNEDAEIYIGVYRPSGGPRFGESERDNVAVVLRGLKWFFRQFMMSHGLCVARAPLTPVERDVLRRLLAGRSEKEIALELGQSAHTTHEYIKRIYRKFGVTSRHALMALWLGKAA